MRERYGPGFEPLPHKRSVPETDRHSPTKDLLARPVPGDLPGRAGRRTSAVHRRPPPPVTHAPAIRGEMKASALLVRAEVPGLPDASSCIPSYWQATGRRIYCFAVVVAQLRQNAVK